MHCWRDARSSTSADAQQLRVHQLRPAVRAKDRSHEPHHIHLQESEARDVLAAVLALIKEHVDAVSHVGRQSELDRLRDGRQVLWFASS